MKKYLNRSHPGSKRFLFLLGFLILVMILNPILVGEDPLFCIDQDCEHQIKRLIPYNPQDFGQSERLLSPLSNGRNGRHWMGTDHLGRDIAALWFDSLNYSFLLSLIAGFTALFIGLLLGGVAGYFGRRMPSSHWWVHFIIVIVVICPSLTLWFFIDSSFPHLQGTAKFILALSTLILTIVLWRCLDLIVIKYLKKIQYLNIDAIVLSTIELFESIPGLLILMSLLVLIEIDQFWQVGIILGLLGWMTIARYVRSEAQLIRTKKYIRDYRKLGFRSSYILIRHFLPQIIVPVSIVMSYSIAAFILAESTLSFLGIGLPVEYSSWGNLLNDARRFPKAWWLGIFPGLGIFLMVLMYHQLAKWIQFSKRSNPQ